jgi:hypothetical protein
MALGVFGSGAGNQWRWAALLLQEMESASWTAEFLRVWFFLGENK